MCSKGFWEFRHCMQSLNERNEGHAKKTYQVHMHARLTVMHRHRLLQPWLPTTSMEQARLLSSTEEEEQHRCRGMCLDCCHFWS